MKRDCTHTAQDVVLIQIPQMQTGHTGRTKNHTRLHITYMYEHSYMSVEGTLLQSGYQPDVDICVQAEKLNGRAAMMGYVLAGGVDLLTGAGLVDQQESFFGKVGTAFKRKLIGGRCRSYRGTDYVWSLKLFYRLIWSTSI